MKSGIKIAGGVGAAAAGWLLWRFLRQHPRRGSAVLRIAFALAVGLGAWWQENLRRRELAHLLRRAHRASGTHATALPVGRE